MRPPSKPRQLGGCGTHCFLTSSALVLLVDYTEANMSQDNTIADWGELILFTVVSGAALASFAGWL
jgi:hypothetical protein